MSLAVVRAMVWAPAPSTEPGMKVRAKSNRSQASWPAVTLLRYEEVAAAGLWMKEARPWPWAAAQVRTPTAPIASAKVEPADISSITPRAVTRSWPVGPRESHHVASSSSRPAKNAGAASPVSREEPMSWATSDPHQTHHGYMVREVVTTPIARTCSGNARRPSLACSLRTEEDSRRCRDTAHLSGDTASDDVTPVRHGGVLELSALIKVALLSLSQIQHRRRLNDRRHDPSGGRDYHAGS